jgi:hypothetical protein
MREDGVAWGFVDEVLGQTEFTMGCPTSKGASFNVDFATRRTASVQQTGSDAPESLTHP